MRALSVKIVTLPDDYKEYGHPNDIDVALRSACLIEAYSRQYVPAANEGWDRRFLGLFDIHDELMRTGALTGLELGGM